MTTLLQSLLLFVVLFHYLDKKRLLFWSVSNPLGYLLLYTRNQLKIHCKLTIIKWQKTWSRYFWLYEIMVIKPILLNRINTADTFKDNIWDVNVKCLKNIMTLSIYIFLRLPTKGSKYYMYNDNDTYTFTSAMGNYVWCTCMSNDINFIIFLFYIFQLFI